MLDPDILGRLEGLDRDNLASLFGYMLGPAAIRHVMSVPAKEKPPAVTGGEDQIDDRA